MKLDFYGLNEQPFGDIPDTRFLYVSSANGQALGSVLVALQKGSSAVSLVGQAGLGKTTLLFHMFNTFKDNVTTVYLFQAPQTPLDLLRSILADLGVREMDEIPQEMFNLLVNLLAEQNQKQRRVVVVIDEAQNLTPPVLEVLYTLSNPKGRHGRLLQFVLSGQSHVAAPKAAEGSMELAPQGPIVAELEALSHEDTARYMDHRLRVAGYGDDSPLFTPEASALIARYSDGVPRKINNLCYTSLSLAYRGKRARVEADIVSAVVSDLGLDRGRQRVIGAASEFVVPRLKEPVSSVPWFERTAVAPVPTAHPPASVRGNPGRRRPAPVVPLSAPVAPAARTSRRESKFNGMLPKLGLAAAVLLTAAATLVNVRRHISPTSLIQQPAPPPAPEVLPATPFTPEQQVEAPAPTVTQPPVHRKIEPNLKGMNLNDAVRALEGQRLNDLCKANFGQCDTQQLQEMHQVNGRLRPHPALPEAKPVAPATVPAPEAAVPDPGAAPLTARD